VKIQKQRGEMSSTLTQHSYNLVEATAMAATRRPLLST
jgi:hypothetical protein